MTVVVHNLDNSTCYLCCMDKTVYPKNILICQNFKYSPSEGFLSGIDAQVLGCPFTGGSGTLVNMPCLGTVAPWSTYMNGERILQYHGVGMKKGHCVQFLQN